MFGLGTIINTAAIIAAGIVGSFAGGGFKESQQDAIQRACGVSVMFIAIAGTMEGMLTVVEDHVIGGKSMLVVLCVVLGSLIGELIGIERGFEIFGEWLKHKSGNSKDARFVDAFVTASLTVCVGAMAIVGAIQDGLLGDYSTLAVKAVLDFIIILVMTSAMGKGAAFSAIPVFLWQGLITLLSTFMEPIMNELATSYLSMVGSILIFCVGINLVWGKKLNIANMLPAVVLAVIAAYLPYNF